MKLDKKDIINFGRHSSVYLKDGKAIKRYIAGTKKGAVECEKNILDTLGISNRILHGPNGIFLLEMPFYGHMDLFELYKDENFMLLHRQRKLEIIYQMLENIKFLRDKHIIHGDIKMENFVVKNVFPLKLQLVDFGFSEILETDEDILIYEKFKGTGGYISPEMLDNKESNINSDIFSVGVILFCLITNSIEFGKEPLCKCYNKAIKYYKDIMDDDVHNLLSKMLTGKKYRYNVNMLLSMDIFKHCR